MKLIGYKNSLSSSTKKTINPMVFFIWKNKKSSVVEGFA